MASHVFNEWTSPDKLALIKGWRRNGLTVEQVAHNIGIHKATLFDWQNRDNRVKQAMMVGKEEAQMIIENKLFEKAMKGDNTSMIFWLKNNWRDKYYETAPKAQIDEDKNGVAVDKFLTELTTAVNERTKDKDAAKENE